MSKNEAINWELLGRATARAMRNAGALTSDTKYSEAFAWMKSHEALINVEIAKINQEGQRDNRV